MAVCTFFGHRDCYGLQIDKLRSVIEELIKQGTDTFYVGNQGDFDAAVHNCLQRLSSQYPHIRYAVVLAYLPGHNPGCGDLTHTMYPEGLEEVHPKFAIERRNRWMLNNADTVVCYVRKIWGGAYRFVNLAGRQGKRVINLYS